MAETDDKPFSQVAVQETNQKIHFFKSRHVLKMIKGHNQTASPILFVILFFYLTPLTLYFAINTYYLLIKIIYKPEVTKAV